MSGELRMDATAETLLREMVQILADLRHHNALAVEMLERIHRELIAQRTRPSLSAGD
ncbi:hypothetical protein NON00_15270 [Roseomonas sp. GC11]|uniref:hypothetical protein n=1 Tax=Roseomonas sp. GC11 TaxID=2950546 RepID=UPI00210D533C|nr:hypothetical protein [Roseomonas sp. GC11]MCQ4161280.1 hypothetical protein [Roseomonas sp. GC11]